jgi:transposase
VPPRYTQQFKDEAVRLVIDGPRPIAHVAAELGIHETTLSKWVSLYRASRDTTEHNADDSPKTARERQLERELQKLREENEFLKKAASFFAREHR